jgi:hypothetical protein
MQSREGSGSPMVEGPLTKTRFWGLTPRTCRRECLKNMNEKNEASAPRSRECVGVHVSYLAAAELYSPPPSIPIESHKLPLFSIVLCSADQTLNQGCATFEKFSHAPISSEIHRCGHGPDKMEDKSLRLRDRGAKKSQAFFW